MPLRLVSDDRTLARRRWGWALLFSVLAIWGLTDVRWRARIDADASTHKTDLTVYTGAGAALVAGQDPYAVANPRGWRYLYPPMFALVMAPLAALPSQAQAVVWFAASLLMCCGCYVECRKLLRWFWQTSPKADFDRQPKLRLPDPPAWIGWAALAAVVLPVMNCLQRGQVGVVVVYLLLLAARLILLSATWRGAVLGGVVLAAPVVLKLTPLLPAGLLVLLLGCRALASGWSPVPTRRALGAAAGGLAGGLLFLILLPGLAVGHAQNLSYLKTWVERVAANDAVGRDNDFNARSKRNQSLENALHRCTAWMTSTLGDGADDRRLDRVSSRAAKAPIGLPVRLASSLIKWGLLALLLVGSLRAAWRNDPQALATWFGLGSALTLLVSPLSWGHHYIAVLPATLLATAYLCLAGRENWAKGLAVSIVALVWAHYLFLDWTGRIGLLGIGTAVWFAAATAMMLRVRPALPAAAKTLPAARRAA